MVVGYNCTNEEEFKRECDVNESGERICPSCRKAVIGITGDATHESDAYIVKYGGYSANQGSVRVECDTVKRAFEIASPEIDNQYDIYEINNA